MCTEHHLGSGTLKPQATFCACKRHKNQAPRSLSPLALSLLVILSSPEAFSSTPRLTTHKLIFHVSAELVLLLKISMRVFNQHHKLIYQTLYSPTGNWLLPCLSLFSKLSPAPSCASLKHWFHLWFLPWFSFLFLNFLIKLFILTGGWLQYCGGFWPYVDMNLQILLFRLHNITLTCQIPFVCTAITMFQPITSHSIVFLHLLLPSCSAKTTEAGGNQGIRLLQVKVLPLLLECNSSSSCGQKTHTSLPSNPTCPLPPSPPFSSHRDYLSAPKCAPQLAPFSVLRH